MSDWWSKKLNGGAPAPTQQRSYPAPPPAPAPPPPAPVAVPQQHQPAQAVQEGPMDVGAKLREHVNHLPDKAIGNRQETASCPGCGGNNYFSRAQGVSRGPAPAPSCFDCGYPLVQAGSGLGSLGGATAAGPVQSAPQTGGGGWNPQVIVGRI